MVTYDPLKAAGEIREQLASDKRRLAFFLGAGTSMAVGIPGIQVLTEKVEENLEEPLKTHFNNLKVQIAGQVNVEKLLDRIRTIRELMGKSEDKEYDGIKGATLAKYLDSAICQAISELVRIDPPGGLRPHLIFAHWLRKLFTNRNHPIELFTTNYDLLFEKAMEYLRVPFFDGFVGSVNSFFAPESLEIEERASILGIYPPRAWTRLWKIHGSINWQLYKDPIDGRVRIARLSNLDVNPGGELVVFPSRDKYMESRKLPFIAFQDRLRKFLNYGEALLVIAGYSFSDVHLNEIIFQGLRSNPRLSVLTLIYGISNGDEQNPTLITPPDVIKYAEEYRNLTVYGPDKASIGGVWGSWSKPSRERKEKESRPFWDEAKEQFTLGNFNTLAAFLELFIGLRSVPLVISENHVLDQEENQQ